MKKAVFLLPFLLGFVCLHAQKESKHVGFYDHPVLADSSSTLAIPVRYDTDLITSSKLALWHDVYANIVFYNFITDSSKRLFDKDTYIMGFNRYKYNEDGNRGKPFNASYFFYLVKNIDANNSEKIDYKDPAVLYVSDLYGNNVRALSSPHENVVSFDIYNKQGFVLLKIQRDSDGDGSFEYADKDFYYVRLDLQTLTFGKPVEAK